jgi:nucleotide-binding universal stress UspA family protein
VLALGSRGLGAVAGSIIGSVCERVVRRAPIDVLVTKHRKMSIGDGPIVVGIDGSPQSFGVLKSALMIARQTGTEVHAVAAYDPYYHYVAFNKIAGVLSDEAGKVFRFKEQEQLHEELIDDGIAKIYQSHLAIAKTVAEEEGVKIICELVSGKPFQAIRKYLEKVEASLLMVGKVGVHADEGLDIGGNTENLLRVAPCHIWIGQKTHYPSLDVIAEETIMWSEEADAMMSRAPDFVRGIARTSVIRQAHGQGHTFITSRFVEDVMKKMMPGGNAEGIETPVSDGFEPLAWNTVATAILARLSDKELKENIRLRAEKAARRDAATEVLPQHVEPFVTETSHNELEWAAAYLARLQRVPEMFRAKARQTIEDYVRAKGAIRVDGEVAEGGFAKARKAMCPEPDATERNDD